MHGLVRRILPSLFALGLTCSGQQWEIGGAAGYGIYRNVAVTSGTLSGTAGFKHGMLFSAVAGHHPYNRLSGEFRYTFRDGDIKITSGSTKVGFRGDAHALHYDALLHAASKNSLIRPFFAFGGGMKVFRGNEPERAGQPLSQLAAFRETTEIKPMLSVGAGAAASFGSHMRLRVDARDYITPFPTKVIEPNPRARLNGALHDIVVLIGISGVF
ncbi:MAG: hypothetical protein Q8N47_00670 [Bryobacterales bacterium]|nr:hypothetical protein [Bryobacterales bacterium]